jgi:K+ transporter
MSVWRYGKTKQWEAEGRQLQVLHEEIAQGKEAREIDGVGIFFDETDARIPAIYAYWLRSFEARHRITVFTHLRQTYHPTVSDQDRFTVRPVPEMVNTFYILLRFGYNEPHTAVASAPGIIHAIEAYLVVEAAKFGSGSPRAQEIAAQKVTLAEAKGQKAPVYIFGRKDIQLSRHAGKNVIRNTAIKLFIFMRDIMTSKPRLWKLPSDQIVELGKAVVI